MSSKTSASIGLAQLLNSEKYSDLKLVCQGQEFKVHKAIVCTQSPVLAAASNGSFQEAATNTINIDEFDAGTVKRMVVFMYGEDYDEDTRERGLDSVFEPKNEEVGIVNQDNEGSSLLTSTPFNLLLPMTTEILLRHIKVNAIADYYDIPQLKRLANTKIQNFLETNWSANNFSAVVEEAFNSTSDTALHKIITSTAAAHIEELVQHEDFTTVTVMSDFALGILRNMIATYKVKEELSAQKLQAAESRLQSIEVSYTYENHSVTARVVGWIASSKILMIVSKRLIRPRLVAMPVARPSSPVISSTAVLRMSPSTHFAAQGAGADIKGIKTGWHQ